LDAGDAERRELSFAAQEFSESDLVRFFHSLSETERILREGAHPRYQLEIGLVKLIEMRRLAPLGLIIERLNALEEALRTGKTPAAVGGTPPGTPAPTGGTTGGSSSTPRSGGGYGGGGGKGTPPGSRAAASTGYEAGREADASTRPEASTSPASKAAQPDAGAPRTDSPLQANTTAAAAAATAAANTPPWEASPWEEPPTASQPSPLKLVPQPLSQGNGGTPATAHAPAPQVVADAAYAMSASQAGGVIEQIKTGLEERRKPFLAIALEGARKVSVEGEELYVEFAPEAKHLRDNLAKPESVKLLREVCASVCGREMGVRIAVKDKDESRDDEQHRAARDAEAEERRRLRELAENHPSVQQVLRAFHAEIVDVRRVDTSTSKQ
jgi:hypothetical protein